MSAFVVDDAHITYLLNAAETFGSLTWLAPVPDTLETLAAAERAHAVGQPWGDGAPAYYRAVSRSIPTVGYERVGQMLLDENYASVNFRYGQNEAAVFIPGDRFAPVTPIQTLKALDCYEYQSCEHPGWRFSEAHEFCVALRGAAIGHLPGYEDAAWEVA